MLIFGLFELPDILATRFFVNSELSVQISTGFAGAILVSLGQIILIHVVGHIIISEPRSISSTYLFSVSKLPAFYITLLMMHIFTGMLTLLLIIPGIIYFVYWSFTAQMVVLEDLRFGAALSNSRAFVLGRWRKVFMYAAPFLLLFVLGIALSWSQIFTSHQYLALAYDILLFPLFTFKTVLFTVLFVNLSAMSW